VSDNRLSGNGPRALQRRRAIRLARAIGTWLAGSGAVEGNALPSHSDLARRFGATSGTTRAALDILEDQGILGRVGGELVMLQADPVRQARETLAVHFRLGGLTVADIYEMRCLVEPDIAASLAGTLSDEALDDMAASLGAGLDDVPHVIALGFHARLAREAANPLLAFLIEFLADMLAELPDRAEAVRGAEEAFRRQTRMYHLRLLTALRNGDAADARRAMLDHLESVQHFLEARGSGLLSRYVAE